MQDQYIYDYSVIRVTPRVEREEFVNVGVIVSCSELDFLQAKIEPDEVRIKAIDPHVDIKLIHTYLNTIPIICIGGKNAGPIGLLPQRERFIWLVSPRSTIIQASPVHTGYCKDPQVALDRLLETMVRSPGKYV